MKPQQPLLSVVIPAYNEQNNVAPLYKELSHVLRATSFETIFVNDGSTDNTLKNLHTIAKKDKKVRVLSFSRNFGKEAATSAGIHHATGKAIIMVDADGQFPAELIPQFIKKWQKGAHVVTGVRLSNQKEGPIKKYGSRLFYAMLRRMGTPITPGATDFKLIDSSVREEYIHFKERNRMTRGLLDWMGFKEETIAFRARARQNGQATYKVPKLIKLAVHSFVSLSLAPLYFSGYAGAIITPLALFTGIFVIIEQFILGDPLGLNVTGSAMLGIMLLFFLGILLISQGLIALYISHIHTETKNRPLYILNRRDSIGIED